MIKSGTFQRSWKDIPRLLIPAKFGDRFPTSRPTTKPGGSEGNSFVQVLKGKNQNIENLR
ncbi:hypothetical protein AKJ65_04295 [candidate division MSBL1 archaeon SCGC-AAA259E19]|uniref:Uncharacterized protein n=1 Tax=candidate division MSBL1 archaeon SCGC-AAA259E19 TaxID=1698264 RepID=A0A133UJV8_9EURY|nr:hypothetical protein AKJ65_04295 [candidate division MSBL1 archaeon SCGC-AAA259E19]